LIVLIRAEQPAEDDLNQPPEFLSNLEDLVLGENALAHFETRLTTWGGMVPQRQES